MNFDRSSEYLNAILVYNLSFGIFHVAYLPYTYFHIIFLYNIYNRVYNEV